MRYGRTSVVNFISQIIMSVAGFVGTIVLTRTLGQSQYGAYVVVLSVLSWVALVGKAGLPQAVEKRVSEDKGGNYVISGLSSQLLTYVIVAAALIVAAPYVDSFIELDATLILVALLGARLLEDLVATILRGQHLVHTASILEPVEWLFRSGIQIALVVSGFGIAGAFAGYFVGAIVASLLGAYFVTFHWSRPTMEEVRKLREYAQFSWLSAVNKRAFLSMDTIILAFFVANGLIAVYEIAWNVASLLAIFGTSIRRTLFPEISNLSSKDGITGEVEELIHTSLGYTGLFIIPGLVGSLVIGDIVLQIYGPGFASGQYILVILTFARLIYGYQVQLRSALDAVDRPDLTFQINILFVGSNIPLNVVLIHFYGWYGAAIATTISATLGLVFSYWYARRILNVTIPMGEIGKQCFAASVMGIIVILARSTLGETLPWGLVLVALGASVYFGILLGISGNLRETVQENLPSLDELKRSI